MGSQSWCLGLGGVSTVSASWGLRCGQQRGPAGHSWEKVRGERGSSPGGKAGIKVQTEGKRTEGEGEGSEESSSAGHWTPGLPLSVWSSAQEFGIAKGPTRQGT